MRCKTTFYQRKKENGFPNILTLFHDCFLLAVAGWSGTRIWFLHVFSWEVQNGKTIICLLINIFFFLLRPVVACLPISSSFCWYGWNSYVLCLKVKENRLLSPYLHLPNLPWIKLLCCVIKMRRPFRFLFISNVGIHPSLRVSVSSPVIIVKKRKETVSCSKLNPPVMTLKVEEESVAASDYSVLRTNVMC